MRACLLLAAAVACATPGGEQAAGAVSVEAIELAPPVRVGSLGPNFPSLDAGCRLLAFDAGGQVYVHVLGSGCFELASVDERGAPGTRPSGMPILAARAPRLVFDSVATLASGLRNKHDQVYLRDLERGRTVRVSEAPDGRPANDASLGFGVGLALDASGSLVAWNSFASNLVEGDRGGQVDVFVREIARGETRRASVAAAGGEADGLSSLPSLSADGNFVAFASDATNLVQGDANGARDVFVRDLSRGRTERISLAARGAESDGDSDVPALSADGRYVAFASDATNLVPGDSNGLRDVFRYDRETRQLARVSESPAGAPADGESDFPAISQDGSRVAFVSWAANLASPATGGVQSVYVRDLPSRRTWLASAPPGGAGPDDESGGWGIALSGDGRCLAFTSFASNLVPGAPRSSPGLYLARLPH